MNGWENLEVHPYAAIVPRMLPRKYEDFKESLRLRGQHDPIIISREDPSRILDGRHRFWASQELGISPAFALLEEGKDEIEFILDKEESHKELTKSQKAIFGYFLSKLSPVGRPRTVDENCEDLPIYTQEAAAKRVGVSRKQIGLVKRILESDSPVVDALGEGLSQGRITVNHGLKFIAEPADVQGRAMETFQNGMVKSLAKATAQITEEIRHEGAVLDPSNGRPETNDDAVTIVHSTVADLLTTVHEASVDVVVTIPSTDSSQLNSLGELHAFSVHALPPTGIVAVIADPAIMDLMFESMGQSGLQFVTELVIVSDSPLGRKNKPHQMTYYHKPVLVFGKEGCRIKPGGTVLQIPSQEGNPSRSIGRLMEVAIELVLKRVAEPGQRVCDPIMLDRSYTATAARKHGCAFIGASHDVGCVDRIRRALSQDLAKGKMSEVAESSTTETKEAGMSQPTQRQAHLELDGER